MFLVTFFVNALTSAVVTEQVPINTNFSRMVWRRECRLGLHTGRHRHRGLCAKADGPTILQKCSDTGTVTLIMCWVMEQT